MNAIVRSGVTQRWADSVAYQGLLWMVEVPAEGLDIHTQTHSLLSMLQQRLQAAGSDVEGLLQATIHLTDRSDLAAFNAIWDAWIPAGHAPVRACIAGVQLADPTWRVEIAVTAAMMTSGQINEKNEKAV